jgi:hypothetical protein
MWQSLLSWEDDSRSASHEMPRTLTSQFFVIHLTWFLYIRLGLPRGLFPSGIPSEVLCAFLIFLVRFNWRYTLM